MTSSKDKKIFVLTIMIGCVTCVFAYWPGLYGPLLFDDFWNFSPVYRWFIGEQSFLSTLLPDPNSILSSRPVSVGATMLNITLGGPSVFALKAGNLLLHVLCGVLGGTLLLQLLKRDTNFGKHATVAAAVATTVWLVHPLHVSTVLYVVQRMAQLSTLFALSAVLCYTTGRVHLESGDSTKGAAYLFVFFPILVLLGLLSKQNAAAAALLCLVIEIAYFRKTGNRQRLIPVFYGIFVAAPLLVVVAILISAPETILSGYSNWDFSLSQRLLTQPRALVDYIGMWLVPRTSAMGLYTDDYVVSTSLFSPASTVLALCFLMAVTVYAVLTLKTMPSLFAGWFFFLAGHSIEASFLPLEMYYEHRNYLPAFGLLLAASAILRRVFSYLSTLHPSRRFLYGTGGVLVIAALSFSTYARSLVWQDEYLITEQGIAHHPDSIRARLDRLSIEIRRGDFDAAEAVLDPMLNHRDPRHRLVGRMDRLVVRCLGGLDVDLKEIDRALEDAGSVITVHEIHVATLQEFAIRSGACLSVPPEAFADGLRRLADAADNHPESTQNKSTVRRIAAQLYGHSGRWDFAQTQAEIGWKANPTIPLGLVLARSYAANGTYAEAVEILSELRNMPRAFDEHWHHQIDLAEQFVAMHRQIPSSSP